MIWFPGAAGPQLEDVQWGDQDVREVRIAATLSAAAGEPVEGLIPATISITRPDGVRSDCSRHAVFRRGQLDYRFPVAVNVPHGEWRITVSEHATGKTQEIVLTIGAAESSRSAATSLPVQS